MAALRAQAKAVPELASPAGDQPELPQEPFPAREIDLRPDSTDITSSGCPSGRAAIASTRLTAAGRHCARHGAVVEAIPLATWLSDYRLVRHNDFLAMGS
jgi:hypothetical protein